MRHQPHARYNTYRRRGAPQQQQQPAPRGGGGKKALVIALAVVFLLAAGGSAAFWLLGGMDLFAEPPVAYTTGAEVRALRVEAPEGLSEAAMRAHFEQAADFAGENGFNTLVFAGKAGLAVWWRDGIFPTMEEVAKNDGLFSKTDPLALLCQVLEGREIQLWLAADPYSAAGYYADAKGKAAALAGEKGGAAHLAFQPGDADYEKLLVQSLAALPKKYPLAGLVLECPAADAGPAANQLAGALPALAAQLNAALAEKDYTLPLLLAYNEAAGTIPADTAAAMLADGTVGRLLAEVLPGAGLSGRLQVLAGQAAAGSLVPVYTAQDSAAQVFFTARQSAAYGGVVMGSWPADQGGQATFAYMESALAPAEGTLPAGFDIPQLLAVNYPPQNHKTSYESLFIVGTSDPDQPLTFDGAEIARADKGAFGVLVELEMGENAYTVAQGGTTLTLKVERVEPTGGGGDSGDGTVTAKKGQVVRVVNTFAGALKSPGAEADMNETLPTGATFVVQDSARIGGANRWAYQMPSGDWVSAYNVEWLSGDGKSTFTGLAARQAEGGSEYIDFEGTGTPAAYVAFDDATGKLTLTFYDTAFTLAEGFSSSFVAGAAVEQGENGAVDLVLQTQGIWGYAIEYDTEANATRLYLKKPPVLSADPQKPLTGVRIVVDPGHGDTDIGAPGLMDSVGPNEKDINLALGKAVAYRLRQLGATVIMTRDDDSASTTMERLELENAEKPDFFLAVHHNAMNMNVDINAVHGVESYYYHPYGTPGSKQYAQNLLDCVSAATGRTARNDGAAKWGWFNVVRTTVCPSVLFEYGFMASPAEFEDISSTDGIYAAACGTAEGILRSMPGWSAGVAAPGQSTGGTASDDGVIDSAAGGEEDSQSQPAA